MQIVQALKSEGEFHFNLGITQHKFALGFMLRAKKCFEVYRTFTQVLYFIQKSEISIRRSKPRKVLNCVCLIKGYISTMH